MDNTIHTLARATILENMVREMGMRVLHHKGWRVHKQLVTDILYQQVVPKTQVRDAGREEPGEGARGIEGMEQSGSI